MSGTLKWIANQIVDRTGRGKRPGLGAHWRPGGLDDYFIDLNGKLAQRPEDADARAAQLRSLTPVALCQLALAAYQRFSREHREEELAYFLSCADTLVDTQQTAGRHRGAWTYTIRSPYRSPCPWVSAMAQGQALSVLIRACGLDSAGGKYEKAAHLATLPFHRTVAEGGVTAREGDALCLEEYPSDPPSHVLNGWVFAWMGLNEYAAVFDDAAIRNLVAASLEGLKALLPRYDTGYWSRYDLFSRFPTMFLANRFYHLLHIAQLRAMHQVTGDTLFGEFADRWSGCFASKACNLRYSVHRLVFKTLCLTTGW